MEQEAPPFLPSARGTGGDGARNLVRIGSVHTLDGMDNNISSSPYSIMARLRKAGSPAFAIAILLASAASLGGFAWLVRGKSAFGVPSSTVRFVNPRSADVGPDGTMVVVDSGERRILGLAPGGILRFEIVGESRRGGFYSGRMAGFDSLGRFYIDDTVLDLATSNTAARRCLRYDSSGRYVDTVVSYRFEGDAMSDWEHHPIFMQVRGDTLFWFIQREDGAWMMMSKALLGDGPVAESVLDGVIVYDYLDAVAVSPGGVYLLAPDGTVSFADSGGPLGTEYPAEGEHGLLFPTALSIDALGRLLATDGKRSVIALDTSSVPATATTVLDPATVRRSGYGQALAFMDISSGADGTLHAANEYTGDIVSFAPTGAVSVVGAARLGDLAMTGQIAAVVAAWAAMAAAAAVVALSYYRIFKHRAPLAVKQVAIFVPLIAVMTLSLALFVYRSMVDPLEASIEQMLRNMATIGADRLDPADIDGLRFDGRSLREIRESPGYTGAMDVIDRLVNVNEDPWNSDVYDYLYRKEGESWWVIGSYDYIELYPYVKSEFERVIASGEPAYLRYEDIYGRWLSAFSPVRGMDGSVLAILEVTMSADVLDEANSSFAMRGIAGGVGIIGVFLVVFVAFTAMLLRSIRSIKAGAERIACGDYEVDVDIRSRDEIQDLGDAFNTMSREIRDYVRRITSLNEANSRFVPAEFLAHLGKKDIAEIQLGDQANAEMTILFTDIRHFTDLSEALDPTQVFAFLNDYLSRMGPEIREHGGFIDKYIGDAIMALFPGSADSALEAAHGMFARLAEINTGRSGTGQAPIDMGVGIHRGPLMIGVIGESKRFDGTVLSDAVNLASRLESLTKYYGVRSIVSESTLVSLGDRARFPTRFLDAVRVKGRGEVVRIHELVAAGEGEPGPSTASRGSWDAAWESYRLGRFEEARAAYQDIAAWNPLDGAARLFGERCARYLRVPPAAGWDGVTTFGEK